MDSSVVEHLLELKASVGELTGKVDGLVAAQAIQHEDHVETKQRLGSVEKTVSRALGYVAGLGFALGLAVSLLY